jgi:hypothetical protein
MKVSKGLEGFSQQASDFIAQSSYFLIAGLYDFLLDNQEKSIEYYYRAALKGDADSMNALAYFLYKDELSPLVIGKLRNVFNVLARRKDAGGVDQVIVLNDVLYDYYQEKILKNLFDDQIDLGNDDLRKTLLETALLNIDALILYSKKNDVARLEVCRSDCLDITMLHHDLLNAAIKHGLEQKLKFPEVHAPLDSLLMALYRQSGSREDLLKAKKIQNILNNNTKSDGRSPSSSSSNVVVLTRG